MEGADHPANQGRSCPSPLSSSVAPSFGVALLGDKVEPKAHEGAGTRLYFAPEVVYSGKAAVLADKGGAKPSQWQYHPGGSGQDQVLLINDGQVMNQGGSAGLDLTAPPAAQQRPTTAVARPGTAARRK